MKEADELTENDHWVCNFLQLYATNYTLTYVFISVMA